ncbi:MAG: ATP-dependent ligase [Rhodoglobus sp.]|jgi:hypothetical protein|nr:ATP-dependent ligase [Rhodoglobus sp.]
MGRLIYGNPSWSIEFDDRVLAHLRAVIIAKMRRDERFSLSWDHGMSRGSGHSSIWMHPSIPMQFEFDGSREPALNREWIDQLMNSANSAGGLHIIPEPRKG